MKLPKLNRHKGVAGLNIFLSIIAMIFLIGIIVMVFAVAGSRLMTSVSTDADAVEVINATVQGIKDVPDWFPTFIVLGAMVVLILLVVIIITSIRGSGITDGGA
ncbi:MAG: hypothetical protein WD512_10600 [Candidatus Paceibacterota bacterium]